MEGINSVYTDANKQDYVVSRTAGTITIERDGATITFEKYEVLALIGMLERSYDDSCRYYADRFTESFRARKAARD